MKKYLARILPWSLIGASLVTAVCAVLFVALSAGAPAPKPAKAVNMSTVQVNPAYAWTSVSQGFGLAADKVKLDALPTAAALATQIDTAVAASQVIDMWWGATGPAGTTANRWLILGNTTVAQASSVHTGAMVTGRAMTCSLLWAKHAMAGLATDSVTYTLEKDAVATSSTVTVTAGSTALFTTAITDSFTAGQLVSIKAVQSGTSATANTAPRVGIVCKSP